MFCSVFGHISEQKISVSNTPSCRDMGCSSCEKVRKQRETSKYGHFYIVFKSFLDFS